MMVEDKNSQTCTAAVQHRIARRLNKDTEYSLTCGVWPWAYTMYYRLPWWWMQTKHRRAHMR